MGRTMNLTTAMKVAEHLKANAKRYHREGMTLKDVAAEVSKVLGRPYSAVSICRLRQQLGLDWGRRKRKCFIHD